MSKLFSFFVGLDKCGFDKRLSNQLAAIEQISRYYGGCSSSQFRGGWLNSQGILQTEPSARFDVVQTDLPIDPGHVALWLGRLYEQEEVLVTIQEIQSLSYSIPNHK